MRARRTRLDDAIPADDRALDGDGNTHKKHGRKSTAQLLAVVSALCLVSLAWSNGPMTPVPTMTTGTTGPPESPKNLASLRAAFVRANKRLPRIPRRFVFTYKYNLLEGTSPSPDDVLLKNNVLRTIDSKWNNTVAWIGSPGVSSSNGKNTQASGTPPIKLRERSMNTSRGAFRKKT